MFRILPTVKYNERSFAVKETKILRWTSGVTRLDHIQNMDVRYGYGVASIVASVSSVALLFSTSYPYIRTRDRELRIYKKTKELNFELDKRGIFVI